MVAVILYQPAFNFWMLFGAVLSVFAFTLQGVADIEMHRFRKRKTGGFIRDGLWKYSSHPNYLGEICMWWGVAFCTLALMPNRWYFLLGALLNTLLFLFVSIPMAERRQSKKDGYVEYKKQTRALLPIKK
jgi:steroid 5-alpha reductase family enzyme